jgi:dTDP-4-dehydrorhamnose 3,5-epimerase-like enzyme
MAAARKITLKTFVDERGNLTPIEFKDLFDWEARRVYYLTDVTAPRGQHCVKGEKKIYICQKGEIKARLHDGKEWIEFELSGPSDAIMMDEDCFRDFYEFSEGSVLMAISSLNYNPDDYIYDLDEFIKYKNS